MATVTPRGIVWTTAAGAKTVSSFTPGAGDLLVAVVGVTGTDVAPTMSDTDSSITNWTLADSFRSYNNAATGGLRIYVSDQGASGSAITVTMTPAGDTGGGLAVFSISGPSAYGASAVRSSGGQADQAAGTPAPVLSNTPLSTNPILIAVMTNSNVSTNAAPRTATTPDYTEAYDQGYNTPAAGLEVQYIASSETSATLTTGGATPTGFCSIGVEIAAVPPPQILPLDAGVIVTGGPMNLVVSAPTLVPTDPAPIAITASMTLTAPTVAFDPSSVAGLYAWYDADQLALADNDPVSSWTDESGGGRHATGAVTPLYKTGVQNGLPGVLFDGTDDTLAMTFSADASRTFFVVAKSLVSTAAIRAVIGGSATRSLTQISGTWRWQQNQAGATVVLGGTSTNATVLSGVLTDATAMDWYLGTGSATSFDPDNAVTTGTGWTIGSYAAGQFWQGYVFEAIVYDSPLGTTDREAVRDWLIDKWGLNVPFLPLGVADITTAATMTLTAPEQVPTASAPITTSATMTLTAPAQLTLAGAIMFAGTLAAIVTPQAIPLAAAPITFTATNAVYAPTRLVLIASPIAFAGLLSIAAPTRVPLAAAPITFAGTATVTRPGVAFFTLDTAPIVFAGSASVRVVTRVPFAAAAITFTATAAIRTATGLPLASSAITFAGSLAIGIPRELPLSPASIVFTAATLEITFVVGAEAGPLLPLTSTLAVTLTRETGSAVTFSPDETTMGSVPTAGEFKTEMPGGHSAASFTCSRPEFLDPLDFLYASSRMYEHETDQTWHEGRVVGISESADEISWEIEGWANHLSDDATARWIPYDRDLTGWIPSSVSFRLAVIGPELQLEDGSVAPDPSTGAPAIETKITGPSVDWPLFIAADSWYDSQGLHIALVDYAWRKNDVVDMFGTDPNWQWTVQTSLDDLPTGLDSGTGSLRSPGPGSGTLTATAGAVFARVAMGYYGGSATTDDNYDFIIFWTMAAVVGAHGLPLQGSVGPPNTGRGLLVSDMAEYIVQSWAPLLEIGEIETTTFVVPHMSFRDPSTPMEQLESLLILGGNSFYPMDWFVWGRTFGMAGPEAHGSTWRTSREEGAVSQDAGPDVQRMINGVFIQYDDGSGRRSSVGPPGSNAEVGSLLLQDDSDSNPANRDGARHWENWDAGITSAAGAVLIGQVILADRNRQEWRGEITLPDDVRDSGSEWHRSAEVRAGDWIVVEDADDTRPRRIIETGWSMAGQATVSIGAPPDRLDTLLARLGAVLIGPTSGPTLPTISQ